MKQNNETTNITNSKSPKATPKVEPRDAASCKRAQSPGVKQSSPPQHIAQEKATVAHMISLYGRHCHRTNLSPADLQHLRDYAHRRLDHCRWGQDKPNCHDCPIHCYAPRERLMMRQVMSWVGPRMLLYSPIEALRYMVRKLKRKHLNHNKKVTKQQ